VAAGDDRVLAGLDRAAAAREVVDGAYGVGAKAFDKYGQAGAQKVVTITLNRCPPYRPAGFQAAHVGATVEAVWNPSLEKDVEGFRVYRRQGAGPETLVCDIGKATTCTDSSPPSSGTWDYLAYPYDKSDGNLRAGQPSSAVAIDLANTAPAPPAGLGGTKDATSGAVNLTWAAPAAGDPDAGDSIVAWRVYRDGDALTDRYATVTPVATLGFTDTHAADGPHSYGVAAVDSHGAESAKTSAVTP
jgi:hypothetical protein